MTSTVRAATGGRSGFLVAVVFFVFFVISFLTNILGPLVPDIITDFHVSLTMAAILPFAFFIAYGVMSIPAGFAVQRWGEKKPMVASFVAAAHVVETRPGITLLPEQRHRRVHNRLSMSGDGGHRRAPSKIFQELY